MPYCKYLITFCCILFSTLPLFAQTEKEADITGLWKGTMYNDSTQRFLRYEIAISENEKGKLSGYSHTYFILDDKEYHGVKKVKIKRKDDNIVVEDVELIANNYPIAPAKGVRQLDVLTLNIRDSVMTLSGPFSTNRTKNYASLTGSINVQRKKDFSQSALIPHLEELGLARNLSFVPQVKMAGIITEIKKEPIIEQPVVKTAPVVKGKAISEQPVVKSTPVEKEKIVAEPPVVKTIPIKKDKPVIELTVVKTAPDVTAKVVSEKPIAKTATVASEKAVAGQPIVKITPVIKDKPVIEQVIIKPETGIIKPGAEKNIISVISIPAAVDAEKRSVETIQSVYYKSDSLILTLYDNGEVDGDTVSVLMNGKLIMPRVGLSTNAVRKTIYTKDLGDSIQIVMYAETLGSLPPNTGLLIVNDGTDRYEIRFSGDMERSSAIMFRRKGPL